MSKDNELAIEIPEFILTRESEKRSWQQLPTLRWVWRTIERDSYDGHQPTVQRVKVLQQALATSDGPEWVDVPEFDEE